MSIVKEYKREYLLLNINNLKYFKENLFFYLIDNEFKKIIKSIKVNKENNGLYILNIFSEDKQIYSKEFNDYLISSFNNFFLLLSLYGNESKTLKDCIPFYIYMKKFILNEKTCSLISELIRNNFVVQFYFEDNENLIEDVNIQECKTLNFIVKNIFNKNEKKINYDIKKNIITLNSNYDSNTIFEFIFEFFIGRKIQLKNSTLKEELKNIREDLIKKSNKLFKQFIIPNNTLNKFNKMKFVKNKKTLKMYNTIRDYIDYNLQSEYFILIMNKILTFNFNLSEDYKIVEKHYILNEIFDREKEYLIYIINLKHIYNFK